LSIELPLNLLRAWSKGGVTKNAPATTKNRSIAAALVFFVSLVILVSFTLAWGATKEFASGGDSDQYLAIAESLSAGNGYKDLVGPWPAFPDYARMPGWPTIIALGLRMAPTSSPEAISRFANAFCLACAGMFFCVLTQILGVRSGLSVLAGLAISLSPSLVYLSVAGMSEVSFVMVTAVGLCAVLTGERWLFVGAFILGLPPLIRTNFVLVPPIFCGLAVLFFPAREAIFNRRQVCRMALAFALVFTPSLLWTIRNYSITGRFPLLSSLEGELLYGANNEVVANDLENWGSWVFPDEIPGERPKLDLARRLRTDLALNDYYHRKGVTWLWKNWRALPRLELGKFTRAFVPIPWVPLTASYIAFACRFLLYLFWFALMPYWWPRISRAYLIFCLAMATVHVLTTAIYYGTSRFTHCYIEVFFVPCILFGFQQWRIGRGYVKGKDTSSDNADFSPA
jgi:hypothetical protein